MRLWFTVSASALCEQPSFSFSLKPNELFPGQRALLEVRLEEANSDEPQIFDSWLRQSKNLVLLDFRTIQDERTWTWQYEVTSYQRGPVTVPAIEIKDAGTSYSTSRSAIIITPSRAEGDMTLRENFGKMRVPYDFAKGLWLIPLLMIPFAIRFFRRKGTAKILPPTLSGPSPHHWLKEQLSVIREQFLKTQNTEWLVDELPKVIRQFFFLDTNLPFPCWTAKELTTQLTDLERPERSVAAIVTACEHKKFTPRFDIDFEKARALLDHTERIFFRDSLPVS